MQFFRLIIVSLLCGGLCFMLAAEIVSGLRTGIIRYSGNLRCRRKSNPGFFWFLVMLFTIFILAGLLIWAKVAHDIFPALPHLLNTRR